MDSTKPAPDLRALFKRLMELVQPDLRKFYRVPRKGRIVATYASDGAYWADVQPTRNDESDDPAEPVIPKVEIPIFWGGPKRGLVCPPTVGTRCIVGYFDGDPSYPYISHFRWHGQEAPACEEEALIIQQTPGAHIKIDAEHNVIVVTPASRQSEIGQDKTQEIGGDKREGVGGDWTIEVAGSATIKAGATATVQAPQINLRGRISSTDAGGGKGHVHEVSDRTHEGSYQLSGPMTIAGDVTVTGNVTISGNCQAASRSGGTI